MGDLYVHTGKIEKGPINIGQSVNLEIDIEITFDDAAIGNQTLTYRHGNGNFAAELARARTFASSMFQSWAPRHAIRMVWPRATRAAQTVAGLAIGL